MRKTLALIAAATALPLMCGIYSSENEPFARKYLSEACRKTDYTMTTGFMGTAPLLPALSEGGDFETAYRMFEQTAYPSWLYPVINGATSIWERWNSYTIENGFSGQNKMNSFNHYSLGGVGTWMMEFQAGIHRDGTTGFKRFILQPAAGGHFTYLKSAYDSVYGTIRSSWTAEDGVLTSYETVVPANTSATLYLPVKDEKAVPMPEGASFEGFVTHNGQLCAKITLTSGSFRFVVE